MAGTDTPRDDATELTPPAADAASVVRPEPAAASTAADAEDPAAAPVADDVVTATLRRSPKYTVFLLLGAAVGIVAALILTTAFHGTDQASEAGYTYSQGQVFGFLTLLCVPVGLTLAGILALILDRTSARRARQLSVGRARFRDDE